MKYTLTRDEYKRYVMATISSNDFMATAVYTPEGRLAYVTPCGYGELNSFEDCDYFLLNVEGTDVPFYGDDNIDAIVTTLYNVESEIQKVEDAREECRAFFEKHEAEGWDAESASIYSDWHKDLFGYRPHGNVFGVYVNPHTR